MTYKLTPGWPVNTETGEFVNPETNQQYLAWLAEGNTPEPADPPTQEQLLAKAKAQRQALVDAIIVTTTSGKKFDGDELSQDRMNKAISVAAITGLTSCTWVLADNVPTIVTVNELKEALALSFQAMGVVWSAPYQP